MVSLISSGKRRRGNWGDAKNASRTPFVLHSGTAGGQAIEPSVGNALDESSAVTHCLLAQRLDLLGYSTQIGRLRRRNLVEFARDHLHELASDSRDKGFESGGVHKRIRNADW